MNAAASTAAADFMAGRTLAEPSAIAGFIADGGSEHSHTLRRSVAAAYATTFTDLTGWATATPTKQLDAPVPVRGLVAYLLLQLAMKWLPPELHTALRDKVGARARPAQP